MTSPEVDIPDTDVLQSDDEPDGDESRCGGGLCRRVRNRQRGGWFFVEPVLTAHCLSQFPVNIITQKYTLDWITTTVFNATAAAAGDDWSPGYVPSPCDPNISDVERHLSDRVQSLTSLFGIVESAIFGVPAIIVTVILGAGSDRLGRRYIVYRAF